MAGAIWDGIAVGDGIQKRAPDARARVAYSLTAWTFAQAISAGRDGGILIKTSAPSFVALRIGGAFGD